MHHTAEGGAVMNMNALLQGGLGHLEDKLQKAPPMVVATLPPSAYQESDDMSFWLGSLVQAQWGDGVLDLSAGFDQAFEQRSQAIYHLLSFAEYVCDDAIVPSRAFSGGHFRAYFREDTCWHRADDSVVKVVA